MMRCANCRALAIGNFRNYLLQSLECGKKRRPENLEETEFINVNIVLGQWWFSLNINSLNLVQCTPMDMWTKTKLMNCNGFTSQNYLRSHDHHRSWYWQFTNWFSCDTMTTHRASLKRHSTGCDRAADRADDQMMM